MKNNILIDLFFPDEKSNFFEMALPIHMLSTIRRLSYCMLYGAFHAVELFDNFWVATVRQTNDWKLNSCIFWSSFESIDLDGERQNLLLLFFLLFGSFSLTYCCIDSTNNANRNWIFVNISYLTSGTGIFVWCQRTRREINQCGLVLTWILYRL